MVFVAQAQFGSPLNSPRLERQLNHGRWQHDCVVGWTLNDPYSATLSTRRDNVRGKVQRMGSDTWHKLEVLHCASALIIARRSKTFPTQA